MRLAASILSEVLGRPATLGVKDAGWLDAAGVVPTPLGVALALTALMLCLALALAGYYRLRLSRAEAGLREAQSRLKILAQDLDHARQRMRLLAVMAKSAKIIRNEFLSSISHEVRTPMNTILGMTELVLASDLAPRPRRYLEKVRAAGQALLELLNDLLDLSKIHAHRLRLNPQDFRLRDCVADVASRYGLMAEKKGLVFRCEVAPDVPDHVTGDPGRLRQVLGVLLSNAVKFTGEGRIDVRISLAADDGREVVLRVAVADTGPGIPDAVQAVMFEPFRQADGSATREHGGCGIGLAIASELVAMMGGRLEVESRVGVGSTFHFTVRLGRRETQALAGASGDLSALAGLRAMVVNDQEGLRDALTAMLASFGMDVVGVDREDAALAGLAQARADGRPFRFLLLDMGLPAGGALRLARRAEEPATGRPAAVLLTHAGARGEAVACREAGIAAYLTLPVGPDDLAGCLLMVLGSGRGDGENPRLITTHTVREWVAGTRNGSADGEPTEARAPSVESGRRALPR